MRTVVKRGLTLQMLRRKTSMLAHGTASQKEQEPTREFAHLGAHGVFALIWDDLGLTELLNEHIPADEQVLLKPGIAMKALVLNVLGGRTPLYHVEDWAETIPREILFPGENLTPKQLNDTSLGRHLDRLFEANGESVFNAACLRVIDTEKLDITELVSDTTSRIVFGEYLDEDAGAISITRGHSKDKRGDLKQVMYGMSTTRDGVPVAAQLLSGNTSDKTWHGGVLDKIKKQLVVNKETPLHYVGDSALVTEKNFEIASARNIDITSRLPRTLALADTVVLRAVYDDDVHLEPIGKFSDESRATFYEGCVVRDCVLFGRNVQLGVFRSLKGNETTRKSVIARRKKLLKQLNKELKILSKEKFSCAKDAKARLDSFIEKHVVTTHAERLFTISSQIISVDTEKKPRGRPSDTNVSSVVTHYTVSIEVTENDDALEEAIKKESCFVLVHTGVEPVSAREMMKAYKGQIVVEKRFPFLKDPAWAEVFFVNSPRRVEALGYVLLLALLLWSVMERRVRKNLKAPGGKGFLEAGPRKIKKPTAAVCRRILNTLLMTRERKGMHVTDWEWASTISAAQNHLGELCLPIFENSG